MEEGHAGLPHVRALDGLRGVAVALVLAFHGEVPGFSGGFLGVSVFFTLSGYLITQLLLREHQGTGSIALPRFWGRRLRRLAPASLLTLAVVAVAVVFTNLFRGPEVPGDVLAATFDVANWRFARDTTTYADLFASSPSPVLHFWSLAIEEQLYLLLPAVVLLSLRRGRRTLAAVLTLLTLGGVAASITASDDVAYYGTHTRAPELLAGALLALAFPVGRPVGRRAARGIAAAGLLGCVGIAVLTATSDPTSAWLYRGGLPATSLLSVAIIMSLTMPGPVRWVMEREPAVALGAVSYAVYVFHWPLFLVLDRDRTGLSGAPLFALRVAVTLLAATVSLRGLEGPVRRKAALRAPIRARLALVSALSTVAVLAVVATPTLPPTVVPPPTEAAAVPLGKAEKPELDVLVVGSVGELDGWVRAALPDEVDGHIRTATRPGCGQRLPDRDDGACLAFATIATPPAPAPIPDLVVVGLGTADRVELQDDAARIASGEDVLGATVEAMRAGEQLILTELAALPTVPVLFVDTGPDDLLARQLRAVDLGLQRVTVSRTTDGTALSVDLAPLVRAAAQERLRVLVFGDSTSYLLASLLDTAGRDRLDVVWAGQQNCPLVSVHRTRWDEDSEFDGAICPGSDGRLETAASAFRPDVVLGASSLPEVGDQSYDGSTWAAPGDPSYTRAHDVGMLAVQQLTRTSGAVTLIATTPPLARGKAFEVGPLADPDRLEAWLAQIARWDSQWSSVGTLDWALIATDAESAAGHDLRVDAVHFDPAALPESTAPRLVQDLLLAVARVRAEAIAAGCLVERPERMLRLAACHPNPAPTAAR